jgi:hypothetical protein
VAARMHMHCSAGHKAVPAAAAAAAAAVTAVVLAECAMLY